jgi:4-amino-4-deoxy-L-arabinose transferase-like glycosyltransferase
VALFLNIGAYPLFLEEPRRALIALEMLLNDNLLVPTEFGEYYYRKPPVWNWMIILGYKLFGFNEFAVRVFGILSYLIQGALILWTGSKYVSRRFGHLSALLFLTVVNGLFYMTGVPGEIDLFYSLVTFLMFVAIFHFYEKEKYLLLFAVTYALTAVGVLTKGIPSFAFTALTLLAVSIDRRKFKLLFSWQHFAGIGLLAIILFAYFYAYHQHHDVVSYFFAEDNSLFAQSADKSFLGSGIVEIAKHFIGFPFGIIANLMPAMLILVFFIGRKEVFRRAWKHPLL